MSIRNTFFIGESDAGALLLRYDYQSREMAYEFSGLIDADLWTLAEVLRKVGIKPAVGDGFRACGRQRPNAVDEAEDPLWKVMEFLPATVVGLAGLFDTSIKTVAKRWRAPAWAAHRQAHRKKGWLASRRCTANCLRIDVTPLKKYVALVSALRRICRKALRRRQSVFMHIY